MCCYMQSRTFTCSLEWVMIFLMLAAISSSSCRSTCEGLWSQHPFRPKSGYHRQAGTCCWEPGAGGRFVWQLCVSLDGPESAIAKSGPNSSKLNRPKVANIWTLRAGSQTSQPTISRNWAESDGHLGKFTQTLQFDSHLWSSLGCISSFS